VLARRVHRAEAGRETAEPSTSPPAADQPHSLDQTPTPLGQDRDQQQEPAAQPRRPESAPLIDWTQALKTVDNDRELLRVVAEAALEESPRMLGLLEQALAEQDYPTIQRAAHTVKGNLRTFGVATGIELAQRLEDMGRTESLDQPEQALAALRQLVERFLAELRRFVTEQTS